MSSGFHPEQLAPLACMYVKLRTFQSNLLSENVDTLLAMFLPGQTSLFIPIQTPGEKGPEKLLVSF